MAEYIDLNNTEVLTEAGENAKLVVEEDGELKRIPASAVGQVKTVNGVEPDGTGNVEIDIPVIQSAQVGQTVVVKAVDESGKPTEWDAVDAGALHVTFTINSETDATADVDVSTIADALNNGRYVYATMMGDGFYMFTPTAYIPDGIAEGVAAMVAFTMQMFIGSTLTVWTATMQDGVNVAITQTNYNLNLNAGES